MDSQQQQQQQNDQMQMMLLAQQGHEASQGNKNGAPEGLLDFALRAAETTTSLQVAIVRATGDVLGADQNETAGAPQTAVLQEAKLKVAEDANGNPTAEGTLDVYELKADAPKDGSAQSEIAKFGRAASVVRQKIGTVAFKLQTANDKNPSIEINDPLRGNFSNGERGKLRLSSENKVGMKKFLGAVANELGADLDINHPALLDDVADADKPELTSSQLNVDTPKVVRNTVRATEVARAKSAVENTALAATFAAKLAAASGGDQIAAAQGAVDAVAAGAHIDSSLLGVQMVGDQVVVTGAAAFDAASQRADELAQSYAVDAQIQPAKQPMSMTYIHPDAAAAAKPVPAPTPIAANQPAIPA